MLKELSLLGVNENTVYPGLDGLGKTIKSKYSQEYSDNWDVIPHIFQNQEESII